MEERLVRSGDDAIDLQELFSALLSRRWWIFSCVVICASLATIYAFVATPVYRASTVLAPATHEEGLGLGQALGQLGGLASLAGVGGGGSAEVEEALAVMRSRDFTERFLRDKSVLPALYPKLWDVENGRWRVEEAKQPTYSRAYRLFHQDIRRIDQDKKTGLIVLSIDWRDRQLAADWANELVARLNEEMRQRAIARTGTSLGFLELELQGTSAVETRTAISRLIENQVKQRMLANVTDEYAFRVVDRALPADADDPVRPRKLALIAIGVILGGFLGVVLALWRAWRQPAS